MTRPTINEPWDKPTKPREHDLSKWEQVKVYGINGYTVIFRCPFCGCLAKSDFAKCPKCGEWMYKKRGGEV